MADLSQETKTSLRDKLARYQSTAKNMREKYADNAKRTAHTAFTIGGGALGGYLDTTELGKKDIFGVNATLAVGIAGSVVSILGFGGEMGETIGSLGTGMLAYEAGKRVREGQK